MASLIGPINSGLAVGAEGVATASANSPQIVKGRLLGAYVKYNLDLDATTDLCINGTFDHDGHWTKGANWTIGTHKARAAAADENLTAAVDPLTVASVYYIVYTLEVTTGTIRISDGVSNGTTRAASGTYAELFTAGDEDFEFDPVTTFTGTVDNVYIYEYDPQLVTDVILATAGTNVPAYTLLTLGTTVTDALVYPRVVPDGLTGEDLAALTIAEPWPVCDYINVLIDHTVPGNSVDVWLLVEDK